MSLSSLPPTWKDEGSFESTTLAQGLHPHFNMKPNFLGAMRSINESHSLDPPWIYRLGGWGGGLWRLWRFPSTVKLGCHATRRGMEVKEKHDDKIRYLRLSSSVEVTPIKYCSNVPSP